MIGTWRMALEGIEKGMVCLKEGLDATQALLTAIQEVEDNPYYKSVGYGGLPNNQGQVQLDAGFMDGDDFSFGAIGALEDYPHAFRLAVELSKLPTNNFRVGQGASLFAEQQGHKSQNMLSDRAEIHFHNRLLLDSQNPASLSPYNGHDTVGILAIDEMGKLCAGTSTSGLFMKETGRLGDSPVIGSGFYADSQIGGATATGLGEDLMKGLVSFQVVQAMAMGLSAQQACDQVLTSIYKQLMVRRGQVGDLSVVALGANGDWGAATTIDNFSFVVARDNYPAQVYLISKIQDGPSETKLASSQWLEEYINTRKSPLVKLSWDKVKDNG